MHVSMYKNIKLRLKKYICINLTYEPSKILNNNDIKNVCIK